MNTNQSNVSFQSIRVFCSKAKTRLFLLASLPCLIGSAWAGSPSVELPLPGALMKYFKGSLVPTPDSTPFGSPIMPLTPVPLTPAAKSGPTPGIVLPTPPPANRPKR